MQVSSPHEVVLARSDVAKGAYRAVLLPRASVLSNRFRDGSRHMKLADSAGKLKTIGFGHMLMLWDGNVMYVLFEAGSEAVLSSH